jgi:hypothetical protein
MKVPLFLSTYLECYVLPSSESAELMGSRSAFVVTDVNHVGHPPLYRLSVGAPVVHSCTYWRPGSLCIGRNYTGTAGR